jgi:hypothetical protein
MRTTAARTASLEWIGAALFIAVAAIYCFSAPTADPDLWGHVHFGRAMLESGSLPATNEYSYTAPDHPWVNHEILAECIFAAAYDRFGSPGLLLLKLGAGLVTLSLMARASATRTSAPLVWAGALFVCASLMAWGYLIRPQIFSFLGLAIVWERILTYEGRRVLRSLLPLPLVIAVWVNTHGGVLAGLGVLLVYVAVRVWSVDSPTERLGLFALAALCIAAIFANPYGIVLPRFLLQDVAHARPISEWLPIPLFDGSAALFKSTVVLAGVGAVLFRRNRWWEAVIVGLAAAAAFRHQRHLPLFAILVAPLLTETLDACWRSVREPLGLGAPSPLRTALFSIGLAALAIFEVVQIARIYEGLHFQILASPDQFPVDAVRFIKRNELRGNLAVPFDWGEYAIWHLYPRCRVSIDGRYTTAYPQAVLDSSARFSSGAPGWDEFLRAADVVLLDRRQPIVARLLEQPAWQDVYSDQTALVFVRKAEASRVSLVREWRSTPEGAFFFP